MNIRSFINDSKGRWVVQRTTYDFQAKRIWNVKSNVTVNQFLNRRIVSKSDAQGSVDNSTSLSLIWGQKASSCNIVIYPHENKLEVCTKKIVELRNVYARKIYYFNSNLLNIRFSDSNFCVCEKLWFVSNNLALGISIVKYGIYYLSISFESKIRI